MSGMAQFYLPEKVAMFVPVFAELERNTFGSPDARKRNTRHYLKQYIAPLFKNDCRKLQELLCDEGQVERVKKEAYRSLDLEQQGDSIVIGSAVLEDIDMFYDGGHSFFGWNFRNLTAMPYLLDRNAYQGIIKLRKHLINELREMNSFILPPED